MLLSLDNVSKRYGETDGVLGVSLDVEEGQIIGLLGPNGSGKTTLLRLAAGMLTPTGGRVRVRGGKPRDRRRDFAFLSTTNYYPGWMAAHDIERMMKGLYGDFSSDRFAKLLGQLDVPAMPYKALSRGNQTKLTLATALAREVGLYLLDEPLTGIDFITRESIIEALISEWRADATVILSTHEIKEAEGLFDRVVLMQEGKVVLDELAEDLRSRGQGIVDTYRSLMR